MSHYSRVKTHFKDAQCLIRALKAMGFAKVEHHTSPQGLYGFQGDLRRDTAHIIVRRKYVGAASNDLGFIQREDGTFEAIISDYDRSFGKKDDKWMARLKREYGKTTVFEYAKREGYDVVETTQSKSEEIRLVLRRGT
jgi:hypothetical protein